MRRDCCDRLASHGAKRSTFLAVNFRGLKNEKSVLSLPKDGAPVLIDAATDRHLQLVRQIWDFIPVELDPAPRAWYL